MCILRKRICGILYLTGYLIEVFLVKLPKEIDLKQGYTTLRVPNEEVKSVFGDTVKIWFEDKIAVRDRRDLYEVW